MSEVKQVGRLAMRVEGQWWVAYFASPDSMKDAIRLGKVRMNVVQDEGRKQAYMRIFRSFIAEIIKGSVGKEPDWSIEDAPAHERSKL